MGEIRNRVIRIVLLTLLGIAAGFAVWGCVDRISNELSEQMQSTLEDVAVQNKLVIQGEINEKQKFLEGIAGDLQSTYNDNQLIIEHLQSFTEVFGFKRMGYIDLNGDAVTTDGYTADLSDENHFKAGLQGRNYITGVLKEKLGEAEAINVMTVPVYSTENTVEGVLFATYQTERLRNLLDVESFDGKGTTLVVTSNGELIAETGVNSFDEQMDLFDYILTMNGDNNELVSELKVDLKQGRSLNVMVEGDTDRFMYFEPLNFEVDNQKCYIVTILPESVLTERIKNVGYHLERFMVIMFAILVVAFVLTVYSYVKQSRKVVELAYSDKITGGKNYAYFIQKLKQHKEKSGYIVAMDIDEFRIINNICGVKTGDKLLKRIWKILKRNIKITECHARVNADRFIIFFENDNKENVAARFAKITEEILKEEGLLNIPKVMPYFGVYPIINFENIESAYGYANQAKHTVKGQHKANFCFYEDGDYQDRIELKRLEDGFEDAIEDRRFEVWYQPKFDTKNSRVVSAEALVRWRAVDGSLISPGKFIPLFEKNGMISTLDEYVFDEVCRRQKKWSDEGRRMLPVSVNISRASLYYENVAKKYRKIVDSYGLDVKLVQLEITESATIENEDIHNLVDEFHKEGFTLLLDDFGNGYSSLSSLNELQFDVLKLDKSLVDHIGDRKGETLLVHIVRLAQQLGLHITAEGVETKEQVDFLKTLECDDIQGYYFSKPLPNKDYEVMLV